MLSSFVPEYKDNAPPTLPQTVCLNVQLSFDFLTHEEIENLAEVIDAVPNIKDDIQKHKSINANASHLSPCHPTADLADFELRFKRPKPQSSNWESLLAPDKAVPSGLTTLESEPIEPDPLRLGNILVQIDKVPRMPIELESPAQPRTLRFVNEHLVLSENLTSCADVPKMSPLLSIALPWKRSGMLRGTPSAGTLASALAPLWSLKMRVAIRETGVGVKIGRMLTGSLVAAGTSQLEICVTAVGAGTPVMEALVARVVAGVVVEDALGVTSSSNSWTVLQ